MTTMNNELKNLIEQMKIRSRLESVHAVLS